MATRRQYAGAAVQTTITSSLSPSATTVDISSTTGWPSGATAYFVVISPGTTSEEKCLATRSSSTLTLTRGQDGTTGQSHSSGAVIYLVFTATDADEANELAALMTSKGDLISRSSSVPARLAVGTNGHVLTADSTQTTGLKWQAAGTTGIGVLEWQSGLHYTSPSNISGSIGPQEDWTYYIPMFSPTTVTLDRMLIRTASTFSGTGTVRLGLYSNTAGKPDALLLDAGTVTCTAADTTYSVTISQSVGPGFFWAAVNSQTPAASNNFRSHTNQTVNPIDPSVSGNSFGISNSPGNTPYWYQTGVNGAFSTASTTGKSDSAIAVLVRVA